MSSHVLLNLLNDLEKKRQNANLAEQISLFRNELNKFKNKRARMLDYTRGIWKVLSMAFYLSNRFSNPIMFGTIVKRYLSSMLWHHFHVNIIMQTQKYNCEYMYCLYTGKRKISEENIAFYLLKSVQNINNSS